MNKKDRERVIQALLRYELSFLREDPEVAEENYKDLLLKGFAGLEHIDDALLMERLREEFEDLDNDVDETPLQAVAYLVLGKPNVRRVKIRYHPLAGGKWRVQVQLDTGESFSSEIENLQQSPVVVEDMLDDWMRCEGLEKHEVEVA